MLAITNIEGVVGNTNIQTIQAQNVDAHLGRGTHETIRATEINIEWEEGKTHLNNKTMSAVWKNDKLHLRDGNQEIWLPFMEQTSNNELNQYHITKMDLDFESQKHFKLSSGNIKLQLKESFYVLNSVYIFCQRKFNTIVSTTLELCLTDKAKVRLSPASMDSHSVNFLRDLLFMPPLLKNRYQSKVRSPLESLNGAIEKNVFEVTAEVEGKTIGMEGTIHYDPNNSNLDILITDATYFIFSVRDRVYNKLRSIQSDYLSVDENDIVSINLDRF